MSFVIAVPEALTMAASDLANIGSTINAANAAAALPTTGVVAAAADEVSAAVAALFGSYAQSYQAFGAQLSAFHAQFVQSLTNGARSYVVAEATSAAPLQDLLGVVNAPAQALLGRPLIGNGANGADGTGAPGGQLADRISQYIQAFEALGAGTGVAVGLLSLNRPEVLMIIGA
ncbi:PE family protein, partial [Mycobacterium tuberculosis]|uniref:PE family protein n=1 Tax=Mycobacterium tuberculosis TaxID=1773 RepID=UPI001F38091E